MALVRFDCGLNQEGSFARRASLGGMQPARATGDPANIFKAMNAGVHTLHGRVSAARRTGRYN
jgi:hypothetical protein